MGGNEPYILLPTISPNNYISQRPALKNLRHAMLAQHNAGCRKRDFLLSLKERSPVTAALPSFIPFLLFSPHVNYSYLAYLGHFHCLSHHPAL
jgi:hypothetical protein